MFLLARLSVANRTMIALAIVAILVVAALVIPSLNEALFPPITEPIVGVMTAYPGVSPATIEQKVGKPLEQSLQGLPGVLQVTTQSTGGSCYIELTYDNTADLVKAAQQVSQQLAKIQPELPAGVVPEVIPHIAENLPSIQLSVASSEDPGVLALNVKNMLIPALQSVNGIAHIQLNGVRDPIVTVTLDQQKLQAHHLSAIQVQSVVQEDSSVVPSDEFVESGKTFTVQANKAYSSLQSLLDLVIAPATKLSDVATVEQALTPSTTFIRTNGKPGLDITISKPDSANSVTISNRVRSMLPALERKLGADTHILILSDQAPEVTKSMNGLVQEGLIGAGLAILIIFAFLLSARSTLVTAISMPLSVIIALIGLWLWGGSLNTITLTALTVAVGRVVDDSIVVLENIHRHLRRGEPKLVAIPKAVQEVGVAVTASTITTIAVFLPLGFNNDFLGQIFHSFALTVTTALLASLVVALVVIPALAYWFLKTPIQPISGMENEPRKETFSLLERAYLPMIRWTIGHRVITVLIAVVILACAGGLVPLLGTNLFASPNSGKYHISQRLPVGTSQDQTQLATQKIETMLAGIHEVQNYHVTIGSNTQANNATIDVVTDLNADQNQVQRTLQTRLNALQNIGVLLLSNGNTDQQKIQLVVRAQDDQSLQQAATQVLATASKVPNTANAISDLANSVPFIDVQIDPQKAATYGLTVAQVGQALNEVYVGIPVATATLNNQPQQVYLKLSGTIDSVDAMKNLLIPTATGNVKLGDVTNVVLDKGPTAITHTNAYPTATITVISTSPNLGGVTRAVQQALSHLKLPAGVTVSIGGSALQANQSNSQLFQSLLIAVMLVYLIMVATFRNLVYPFMLLISIPFAAIGSFIALLLTGNQLGLPVLIGMLMLIGIVVTNAIVLLDRILQLQKQGMDVQSAVIEGGRLRVRPILMTAVATICALIPMALGLEGSSAVLAAPLAITVIGGLTTSTLLTLLLVPTFYVIIADRKGERKRKNDSVSASLQDTLPLKTQEARV